MRVNVHPHRSASKPLFASNGRTPYFVQKRRLEAQSYGNTFRAKCAKEEREPSGAATAKNGLRSFTTRLSKDRRLGQLIKKFQYQKASFNQRMQRWSDKMLYSSLTTIMDGPDSYKSWMNRYWVTGLKMSLLHGCVMADHLACAYELLSRGIVQPDCKTSDGITPLGFALSENKLEMVALLLRFGANPNYVFPDGNTPLYMAVNQLEMPIVETLLAAGANPYQPSIGNLPPIFLAVLKSSHKMLECMLSEGMEPDEADPSIVFSTFKVRQQPVEITARNVKYGLLCLGAITGDLESVRTTVKYMENVDVCVNGLTPLAAASCHGNLEVVEFLIECGADPYFNTTLPSPLATSAMNGHAAVVEFILQRKDLSMINVNEQLWGLFYAAESGFAPVVEIFLRNGLNPNCTTEQLSPIGVAARNGHIDVVKVLISHGSYVDGSCDGVHPLFMACRNGHTKVVECLLQAGANPNTIVDKVSCLYMAVERNHKEVETLLLSYGANQLIGPEGLFFDPASDKHLLWVVRSPEK